MAKSRVTFNDGSDWTLQSVYPDPAYHFRNWTPDSQPVGDFAHVLSNEQLYRFRTSWRYGASFEIPGIAMGAFLRSSLDIANKLKAHLLNGGTCSVYTDDALGSSYATCGIMPGTMPMIQMTDRRTIEYSMQLSLIDLSASPVEMTCHYLSSEQLAYHMLVGGVYVLGYGNKANEATAFLKDNGSGVMVLDDSAAAETHYLYLVDPDSNLVIA